MDIGLRNAIDKHNKLYEIEVLCKLAERCHATAKFSMSSTNWYGISEKYAAKAHKLMQDIDKETP